MFVKQKIPILGFVFNIFEPMLIRPANPEDKPEIIDLLKKSLGESTIPKSEEFWGWKHEQNPFGSSFVLLAEENNRLIGLRAFMQWQWQWKNDIYKAIRAVDTATHPQHQGKGIFKTLTLQQLEICKQNDVQFVFNTPNEQSKPGYLKMGWIEQGKLPLKFKLLRPISLAYAKIFHKKRYPEKQQNSSPKQEWKNIPFHLFQSINRKADLLTTSMSPEFIKWRYAKNPLFNYHFFTDNESYFLISRIKTHSFAKELRLVDFILLNATPNRHHINSTLKKKILTFCAEQTIDFISFSGPQYYEFKPYFHWLGILPVKNLGPLVTLRDLNMKDQFPALTDIRNWGYSLGDLELF